VTAGPRRLDRGRRRRDARGRDRGCRLGRGQRRVGRNPLLRERALPFDVSDILITLRGVLDERGVRFGHGPARRLELRLDVRVLELRDDRAFPDPGALFEAERQDSATRLHANLAAVPRDDITARYEYRERDRTARRCHDLGRPCHVDLRGAALRDI